MRPNTRQRCQRSILEALLYLERNLHLPLDNAAVAEQVKLSEPHFRSLFVQFVGESPQGYVRRIRLERAASFLRHTQHAAADIAVSVGYESREGLVRAFKVAFGQTPEEFRAAAQSRLEEYRRNLPQSTPLPRIEIVELPTLRFAFLRHFGPYHAAAEQLVALGNWARRRGLANPTAQIVAINYDDDETPHERNRVDLGITIPEGYEPDGGLAVQQIPGGTCAVVRFRGSFLAHYATWRWMGENWLPLSGYQLRDLRFFDVAPARLLPESYLHLAALLAGRIESQLCIPIGPLPSADMVRLDRPV